MNNLEVFFWATAGDASSGVYPGHQQVVEPLDIETTSWGSVFVPPKTYL